MSHVWRACGALSLALALVSGPALRATGPGSSAVTWVLDNLERIGGHAVTVVGTPVVVDTPVGRAVAFNGETDGLFVDANPLAGHQQFTIEALIEPAAGGPFEQRFVHVQETAGENRALLELRMSPDSTWALDTFLRQGSVGVTLIDRTRAHPPAWHTVALAYDGSTMRSYVDGRPELEGHIAFGPMADGRVSIGVRQNKVSWFRGRIRLVRFSPEALPGDRLLVAGQ
jgi:hypothetical protein